MTAGTKIRNLMRLIDSSDAPMWAIGPSGKLVYLSAGVAAWLGVDVDQLLDRRAVAGSPITNDPLDLIAATLSPPPGLTQRGTATLRVQPSSMASRRVSPLDVRFVRVGRGESAVTLAIGGQFDDRAVDEEISDAALVREQLDLWRKRHTAIATTATLGQSSSAKRMRSRIEVACGVRTHFGIFGPAGCGAESIAMKIHQHSAPREPIATVDGPLMDPELLDASINPIIAVLADSSESKASVLVRELDEMPIEAQRHLSGLLTSFGNRLRLIGLCSPKPALFSEPLGVDPENVTLSYEQKVPKHLDQAIVDCVAALTVTIEPLATRCDDIPLLATALVDSRFAAKEGVGERLSRATLDAIVLYPWPNNFEELDSAMRHAVRSATRETIAPENLPLAVRSYRTSDGSKARKLQPISLDSMIASYELKLIKAALEACDGNRAAAARSLGITRSRLIRRVDEASQ